MCENDCLVNIRRVEEARGELVVEHPPNSIVDVGDVDELTIQCICERAKAWVHLGNINIITQT